MVAGTFYVGTALTAIEGAVYIAVGWMLAREPPSKQRHVAWTLFVTWWVLIGANKLLAAIAGFGVAQKLLPVDGYFAIIYVNLAILCISLFCLMSYLLYLFTGTTRAVAWTALGYVVYYLMLTYNVSAGHPTDVGIATWRTYIISATSGPEILKLVVLVGLFFPQVIGSILYASLRRSLTSPMARYRVTLIPIAIVAWSLSITLVAFPGFSENALMQVGSRVVGAGSAILTFLAYVPPASVKARLEKAEASA